MSNDELAKKIAEETVKAQKEAYNAHLIRCWKIAIKGTGVIIGAMLLLMGNVSLPFGIIGLIIIFLTLKKRK